MDISDENQSTGKSLGMGNSKSGVETRHNKRALRVIDQNLLGPNPYRWVVNKRGLSHANGIIYDKNPTRKLTAQIASSHQHYSEDTKKPKLAAEDFRIWEEEHVAAKDQPIPMSLEQEATFSNDKREMDVEMEDIFEEALIDIDSDDANNPLAVVDYVEDLYANYRKMEGYSCVSPNYMTQQFDINERMRAILVDWLVEVNHKFELRGETLFLTVNLIDRFLEKQTVVRKKLQLVGLVAMLLACKYEEVNHKFELRGETLFLTVNLIDRFLEKQTVVRKKLQLVGLVAMLLACKYEEVSVPAVDDLVIISDNAYTRKEVLEMETLMLNTLQFNMSVPTAYVFMRRFLKAAQADRKLEVLSFFLIELCLVEYEMLKFPPSFMAAAAIYTAQCTLYGVKQWSKTCEWHTSYSEDQLLKCSRSIVIYHRKAATGKLTGVHRKYSTSEFGYAAKFEPALFLVQIN